MKMNILATAAALSNQDLLATPGPAYPPARSQVYSGTIAGSAPAMIHDDQFRFHVNLATGEESGQVYLLDHIAGPKVRCLLEVVGTGLTAEGNPAFDYHGTCTLRSPRKE